MAQKLKETAGGKFVLDDVRYSENAGPRPLSHSTPPEPSFIESI